MAKIPVTTAKYTESHDRLTLTVKFADGTKFRLNSSRYRDSASFDAPIVNEAKVFFAAFNKTQPGENNGQRMLRAKAHFERFTNAKDAAAALA